MKRILEIIYKGILALFELITDLLITFVCILLLKGIFNENIYINVIILLITFCGLVYGINENWRQIHYQIQK